MKVRVTTDAVKLWRCKGIQKTANPANRGKLPRQSGFEIEILLPGKPQAFCDGQAWAVAPFERDRFNFMGAEDVMVCEHQIDFLSKSDESSARTFVVK